MSKKNTQKQQHTAWQKTNRQPFKSIAQQRAENDYEVDTGHMVAKVTPIVKRTDRPALPKTPTVLYTPEVKEQMDYIVKKCTQEVGWMGLVDDLGDNTYLIYEIFVPRQQVHGAETDISAEAMAELAMELIDDGHDTSKLYAWFHSHVNMSVSPSMQDEMQVEEFVESSPVFIRGIVNKRGESKVDVYYRDHGVAFNCVNTGVHYKALEKSDHDHLDELLKQNVTSAFRTPQYGNYYNNYGGAYQSNIFHGNSNTPANLNGRALPGKLDDEFDEANESVMGLLEDLSGDLSDDLQGYGIDWDEDTPLNMRPKGWANDPYYHQMTQNGLLDDWVN